MAPSASVVDRCPDRHCMSLEPDTSSIGTVPKTSQYFSRRGKQNTVQWTIFIVKIKRNNYSFSYIGVFNNTVAIAS
jgi:hypothetical protein